MKDAGLSRQEMADCLEKGKQILALAKEEKLNSNRKSTGLDNALVVKEEI
jgi:hypothetical protein